MTRKKTHKETAFMPSVANKLVIVQSDDPAPDAGPRPEELRLLEALLFAAGQPLDEAALARRLPDGVDVKEALAALKAEYATRGVNLMRIGKKWMFRTAEDLSWLLTKETVETRKLSRAAIETRAIIAYHQPVTRAEMELIRGVQTSRGSLDVLLELGLVRMRGRRRTPGRPVTYGTTDRFLEHYGLASIADLPGAAEMKAAGLLELDLPAGFSVPDPAAADPDEDPLDPADAPEFHQDYLGEP
jgi:segregation and condensation protein B